MIRKSKNARLRHRLEDDPRFLRRIEQARKSLRAGRGIDLEVHVTGRRIVAIPAKDWKKFEAWANRPAEELEGLKDLVRKPPKRQE